MSDLNLLGGGRQCRCQSSKGSTVAGPVLNWDQTITLQHALCAFDLGLCRGSVTDEELAGDVHAEEGPSVGRAWYGQLPSPSCARQDTRQSIEFETDGGPRRVYTAAHPGRRQVPTSHPRRSHTRNSPTGPQPSTLTGGSTWRVTQRAFHSATDCCCLLRCCPPGHTVASDAVADHPSALV